MRRMRIACWIPKATNSHSQYVILVALPLQQRLHESASKLRYTYIVGLVHLFLNTKVRRNYVQYILYTCLHNRSTKFKDVQSPIHINLLKPTGYVMHQQFNIQQLYALPTLYLCVLYLSENKQRLVPLTA